MCVWWACDHACFLHVCGHTYVGICAHMCTYIWKLEVDLSLLHLQSYSPRQGLSNSELANNGCRSPRPQDPLWMRPHSEDPELRLQHVLMGWTVHSKQFLIIWFYFLAYSVWGLDLGPQGPRLSGTQKYPRASQRLKYPSRTQQLLEEVLHSEVTNDRREITQGGN